MWPCMSRLPSLQSLTMGVHTLQLYSFEFIQFNSSLTSRNLHHSLLFCKGIPVFHTFKHVQLTMVKHLPNCCSTLTLHLLSTLPAAWPATTTWIAGGLSTSSHFWRAGSFYCLAKLKAWELLSAQNNDEAVPIRTRKSVYNEIVNICSCQRSSYPSA